MPEKRSFSERMGLKPVKAIQIRSMDIHLRNGLWNVLTMSCWRELWVPVGSIRGARTGEVFFPRLWGHFFKRPLDTLQATSKSNLAALRKEFFAWEWNEVYDFLEFTALQFPHLDYDRFAGDCNFILERELSAYRLVGRIITPITSEVELATIEDALAVSGRLGPVQIHMERALALLSDRKSPDYRNSIKESVSAVEAMCRLMTGNEKAKVGDALAELEKTISLHSALKKAFSSLYGYSSDAEGIRHALLEEPNLDFDDAKFMLVCCSAFVNYLKAKSA